MIRDGKGTHGVCCLHITWYAAVLLKNLPWWAKMNTGNPPYSHKILETSKATVEN